MCVLRTKNRYSPEQTHHHQGPRMQAHQKVNTYIRGAGPWSPGLEELRAIITSTELEETVKWGVPCYTLAGRNVVAIVSFKDYFGMWFYDAEALTDPDSVLQAAEGGKSKAMRQWRFTTKAEIKRRAIKSYLKRAIDLSRNRVPSKRVDPGPPTLPPELESALAETKLAQEAFARLTPGRQRDYAAHIVNAKREATKQSRILKILPMILAGKGLSDKYK